MDYTSNFKHIYAQITESKSLYNRSYPIEVIAVSKYQSIEQIKALHKCGQVAFGENKVQDLKIKCNALESLHLQWHFIGTLQENKINALIALKPALLHSLDSLKLAYALQKRLESKGQTMRALLQLNTSFEQSKSGVYPNEAISVYRQIARECQNIQLQGIMTIGAHTNKREVIKRSFEIAKEIFDTLQSDGAEILSMGMSGDFDIAIECGATMLRIGSKFFA
ncbi:YggS family pyridoxal phosphate-dependent enzyme [Helicobacter sp. 23-1048]